MKKSTKLIALFMVALLVIGAFVGCTSKEADTKEIETQGNKTADKSADIVVIGSGGAGLAAALEAKNAGKNVIVVEKMPMVGGNTLRATGGMNAAGTSVQKEMGIEDSAELHYQDTMKGGYEKNDPELVKTMTENAAGAIEWLKEIGADLSDVGMAGGASARRIHRPTGGAAVGPTVIQTLQKNLEEAGVEILTQTTATKILMDNDQVVGIIAKDKDGNEFKIESKAVIVATGGFGANTDMLVEYNKDLEGFGTTNHPGATGDGIKMAVEAGAALVQMEEIQTHPTAVPSNGYMITEGVRGDGAILINRDGKRFINELKTRDVVSKAILAQEGNTAFLLADDNVRNSLKALDEYIEMGLATEADSIEELAEALGVNKENLVETVKNYNGYVDNKNDKEFERQDMATKLEGPKFYAIEVKPAVHHTMGGLKINTKAEVLNEEGNAIKGLYAAGEVTGGVHGGNRLGGNAVADIIIFGRIAGQTAASNL